MAEERKEASDVQTVTLDNKCRVLIPREARNALCLDAGDVVALRWEGGTLQLRKVVDPFDALAEHAIAEHDAGRTHDIRDVAREMGIEIGAP
jgi:bifunctional DNA-binding transcriptional regulator/antitoxin component of YhaV-PrlF toxin-antitoxin module